MHVAEMRSTRCAICGTEDAAVELYPANFADDAFTTEVFSARRLPDRIRYRIVRCRACGLVRSDPIADPELLTRLYAQSTFDYSDEVAGLRATYGRYLRMLERQDTGNGALLEIGCGNGFMLEEALAQGYSGVRGVEPSAEAIAKASPLVRPFIVRDVMHPGLFAPDSFDVICLFQVFDHIPNPGEFLDHCFEVLKPGGLVLCLNHNVAAVSARLLKERSPIIDIEHTYLYSPTTIQRIFSDHGFQI
ncbi:MAG TPA: class I SAM-dependent methyltransferase, partial [Gemmatimonadaceae bacterium]